MKLHSKMNKSWQIRWIVVLSFLYLLPGKVSGQIPAALSPAIPAVAPDSSLLDHSVFVSDESNIPLEMLDLMRDSRSKYLEGSNLIRAGDSDKAREKFNEAVDMLLQSTWDLASTPTLNRFFQDLIQRIQEDESLYLLAPPDAEDSIENAVADDLDDLDLIPITIDPALKDVLVADLPKTEYEIPITVNGMVMKSLDFWLNGGRKYFVDGLLRSGQYRPIIEKVFREESIPLDLMYLAQVESLFKPKAVSKAKAKGIWQFEKGTAIRYGLKVNRYVDERSDPEKSTRAAARYLNDLFTMFKDWNLALAAYNWGEGKVQRLVNRTGLRDFWQLVNLKRKLPEETKNHIPLIQASVILARNPEKYGLPTELDPPLQYTKVSISKPIDLRAAARVLNTSTDELKRLNPALRGLITPANYPDFQLKVPADTDPESNEKLAALPRARIKPPPEYEGRHKVRPGETLSGIAVRYRVSVSGLMKANRLSSRDKLRAGTWLQVPSSSSNLAARGPETKTRAVFPKDGSSTRIKEAPSKTRRSGKPASPESKACGKAAATQMAFMPGTCLKGSRSTQGTRICTA
jgi:membrane-bound lytic murein transglycosylase D